MEFSASQHPRSIYYVSCINGDTTATHDTARKHLTNVARDLLAHEAAGRLVATEDLPTSHAQQKALSTGILNSIRCGRNEGGLQQFHRWTNILLDTPDGELSGLFSRGING